MRTFLEEYEEKLFTQEAFTCYHPDGDLYKVVPEIKFTSSDVLHSMLWPSLFFVISGLLLLMDDWMKKKVTKYQCYSCTADKETELQDVNVHVTTQTKTQRNHY